MVQAFRNDRIAIHSAFYIVLSFSLLIIPFRWVAGWFAAVFFHELCHYIALRLCKVPVFGITVRGFGADIQTGPMTTWKEIICAIAGPAGSLLLLFFMRVFPYVSLCAFVQSLFNLMPIYPMDGGRVVAGICVGLLGERKGYQFSKAISVFFLILLICVGLWLSLHYQLGVAPVLLILFVIIRALKIPCKERQLIVQ